MGLAALILWKLLSKEPSMKTLTILSLWYRHLIPKIRTSSPVQMLGTIYLDVPDNMQIIIICVIVRIVCMHMWVHHATSHVQLGYTPHLFPLVN